MALTKAQEKQAEKNRKYWADREDEVLKHRITDEKEYERQIKKIYAEMIDNCQKEINSFYVKYANAEGISLAEAKKRVSKLDIAAYERKAARYVKDKDFSKQANEEMRLYNATMKINRLEMLKANLGLELISGHNELEKFMGGILKGRTEDELKRQAGILGKTIKNPAENAEAIINASFHNANFSDRIWLYQNLMKADLEKLLKTGIIQGKNPNVLARELTKRFDVGRANAERLMRTELARVQTEAQKQSFERNGFTEYEFIVNGGCCDICAAINGKHFKVKDMLAGENAPPMHPNCRCSTAAYEDSTEYNAWLEHLSNGGTTETWENRVKIRFPGNALSYKRSLADIAVGKAGLDKRRQNILSRMPNSGDYYKTEKNTVTKRDIAYLSAATGNEFALFRSKNNDIVIRGTRHACDIIGELGEEILKKKYEWVVHSHVDRGNLTASTADRETLIRLGQRKSSIVGIDGEEIEFYQSLFNT